MNDNNTLYQILEVTEKPGYSLDPDNHGGTYKSDVVKNIVPSFPYIPATCT